MKILLLGSGGREHALAWKIAQSKQVEKLYIAPGNAGTGNCGENVNIGVNDFEELKKFVYTNHIDMVVVGPEDPLVKGIYDNFANDLSPATSQSSVRRRREPCSKARKTSPRRSCSDTTSRQLAIRLSTEQQ